MQLTCCLYPLVRCMLAPTQHAPCNMASIAGITSNFYFDVLLGLKLSFCQLGGQGLEQAQSWGPSSVMSPQDSWLDPLMWHHLFPQARL